MSERATPSREDRVRDFLLALRLLGPCTFNGRTINASDLELVLSDRSDGKPGRTVAKDVLERVKGRAESLERIGATQDASDLRAILSALEDAPADAEPPERHMIVMTDAMFASAKRMREMLDGLGVLNTRYLSDGQLAIAFDRLCAASEARP